MSVSEYGLTLEKRAYLSQGAFSYVDQRPMIHSVDSHVGLLTCPSPFSRLNVIFSKFDEVQRSGNMVLSPVSGRIK